MTPLPGEMGLEMMKGFATGPREYVKTEHKCPKCEEFMYFSEKGIVHNDPPRKRVVCRSCDYKGFVPYDLGNTISLDITKRCSIRRSGPKNVEGTQGADG